MGALIVRVGNALRQPLDDLMDVQVVSARTDALVGSARGVQGKKAVRFDKLVDNQPYIVKVFPTRHRPVAQFAFPGPAKKPVEVQLYAPLDPERVREAIFPVFAKLDPELRRVLEVSSVEGTTGSGEAIYSVLTDTQKAGLLNLFGKMSMFGFDDRRTVWTLVKDVFRIRADRIFVNVDVALRDLVKGALAADRFREVDGSLHTPPHDCAPAGSFKTSERYGNLQLTFFSTLSPPLAFKVDADIDDAAGLGHAFQVLRNFVSHGTTHPYDIHQILAFRQEIVLPYTLA